MKYATEYQLLNVTDIIPAPYNPREDIQPGTEAYMALRQSLMEHGLVEPLVVNLYNMHCVGGNQRLAVVRDLGWSQVLCSVINQPDEQQEKKLCLALNRIDGRWDNDKLAALLNDDEVMAYTTGFSEAEAALYQQLATTEKLPEPAAESDLLEQLAENSGAGMTDEILTTDLAALPTANLMPEMVFVKIGHLHFKAENALYQQLLADIRGGGIFAVNMIAEAMKGRLLRDD